MATTYLHRTPGSAGNRRTWTVSAWVKFAAIGDKMMIFTGGTSGSDETVIVLDDACTLRCYQWTGSYDWHYETSRLLRDPSAWYHIVVAADTTNATADDRIKIYINGTRYTGPWDSEVVPSLNQDTNIMNTDPQKIGTRPANADYFNGVMAHVHLIDGTQYAASDFGETDSTSGIWVPKTGPSVTYGTQGGFYKFASGALGTDSSGNGNTMTVSGTMTNTKDTPDNNFATLNSIDNYLPAATFSNGNNTIATVSNKAAPVVSTIGMTSGKWYFEVKPTARGGSADYLIGICSTQATATGNELGNFANDWGYYSSTGGTWNNNTNTAYGDTYDTDDIIGVAVDLTNSKLYFSKNGTWQNSGVPTSGATGTGAVSITAVASTPLGVYFAGLSYYTSASATFNTNFGNGYFGTTSHGETNADDAGIGLFKYDVPAGYYALCTTNLGDQS